MLAKFLVTSFSAVFGLNDAFLLAFSGRFA